MHGLRDSIHGISLKMVKILMISSFDDAEINFLAEKSRQILDKEHRIPREVYGKLVYEYCKSKRVKRFSIKKLDSGYYPKLKDLLTHGQIRQGFIFMREKGLAKKDGDGWKLNYLDG